MVKDFLSEIIEGRKQLKINFKKYPDRILSVLSKYFSKIKEKWKRFLIKHNYKQLLPADQTILGEVLYEEEKWH